MSVIPNRSSKEPEKVSTAVAGAVRSAVRVLQYWGQSLGISSGLNDLDGYLGGFQPGQLIVVTGLDALEKTALALNFAEAAVLPRSDLQPVGTLVASGHQSSDYIAYQLILSRARVRADRLRAGVASLDDKRRLARAAAEIRDAPLFFRCADRFSVGELEAEIRRQPTSLLVLDSMQSVTPTVGASADRWEELSSILRILKGLAMLFKIPLIVTAPNDRSAPFAEMADAVLVLSRPVWGENECAPGLSVVDLVITKNRNGPTGTIGLVFARESLRFDALAYEEQTG